MPVRWRSYCIGTCLGAPRRAAPGGGLGEQRHERHGDALIYIISLKLEPYRRLYGQVNLGIVAFFGVSTLVTHFLWKGVYPSRWLYSQVASPL